MELSEIIKKHRRRKGLTMKQLADLCKVQEATISRWESGNIKSIKTYRLKLLAEALDLPLEVFLGNEINADDHNNSKSVTVNQSQHSQILHLKDIIDGKMIFINDNYYHLEADYYLISKIDNISMDIKKGDIIFIKKIDSSYLDQTGESELIVFFINDEFSLKEVYHFQRQLLLMDDISNPILFDKEKMIIVGKVICIQRKI